MVRRIYVEKKLGFDVEAKGLKADLKKNLNLENLEAVRVFNRYDIEGLSDEVFENAKYAVFAEAPVDNVYEEELPEELIANDFRVFASEYLPGQYDQRADSAVQCIKMMAVDAECDVKYAKVVALQGKINDSDFEKIKNYYINPVDSREAELEKKESLAVDFDSPAMVEKIAGFREMDDAQLAEFLREKGLAMTQADIKHVQSYYREEKREPSIAEIKVIDTYWSDHCRHTTFMTELEEISFEDDRYARLIKGAFAEYLDMRKSVYGSRADLKSAEGGKDICLMDLACIGAKYLKKQGKAADLDESEEINACSIKVKADIDGKEEDWIVMFKNETHNHPTEIEPFGGAATCLGGAIRDPLSGRVYVYQAMRVTGSADPRKTVEETLKGKLPQRKITQGAAAGYSSYGNQIGLATGQVSEIYHEGYVAKRMEVGAVVGAAPAENIRRERPAQGDAIILVGGRTGRDGCGGATGSSREHTDESILTCGAEVQKGNPPVERNLQRLFRRKEVAQLIKRCNDFGAGGVSVAIGELADSIDVELDLVPKKYEGLDGTELAISESQERMAVVVEASDKEKFIAYAAEENLEAVVVAKVTDSGRFRMFWRNECILDLSREFLNTNGASQQASVLVKKSDGIEKLLEGEHKGAEEYLADLNCASQKGLVERFDSTIGAGTVLLPLGGKHQLSPAAGMAAKLPVLQGDTNTATLMAYGFDADMATVSPYHSALYAVLDSVTKIVAMGGDYSKVRLSLQEYFEKMTEDPAVWAKPFISLLGALKVQKELEIPAIGGKDSMSGTFMDISVPPSLISFAVTTAAADKIISTELKEKNSYIVYIPIEKDENYVPDFDKYKKAMTKLHRLIIEGQILSAQPVGKGGIFMALLKMAVGNRIGAELNAKLSEEEVLRANYGSLMLEVSKEHNLDDLFGDTEYMLLGESSDSDAISIHTSDKTIRYSLDEILKKWEAPLENIFPTKTGTPENSEVPKLSYEGKTVQFRGRKVGAPKVIIPVFPGTNCEIDSKRAFEKAGAKVELQIIRNLSQKALEESIEALNKKIKESQIVFLPGGFSGGDEPDGSAKFIAALFRNPYIKESVHELLGNRDGLMLGICNGFQALIKLGLVPYGQITDIDEDAPTLTYNKIARHVSCLVNTRVVSNLSPWLSKTKPGGIHKIPVSHGEGRFVASEKVLKELEERGQIATQYVDLAGEPTMDISFNPNGSVWAIEGITSPDGRVFGKMGHSERIGKNLYKNVPGDVDQKLFEAGVEYFKL